VTVLILLLGLSLVLGTTVFRDDVARAAPALMEVLVVNDTRNPVPVHEQGTADVNVTNGSLGVEVTNLPLGVHLTNVPLPVREAGETPVQRQLQLDFDGVQKFLVTTKVDGQQVIHSMNVSRFSTSHDAVTERVLIYADPGTTVKFQVALGNFSNQECPGFYELVPNCNGSFSGVLIDAP
jgi:hypothetical protein